jgi:transketolase
VIKLRNHFFKSLLELAKKDSSIVLMTADMGFGLLEPFRDELPGQYINSGISEANTVSMAAGMALRGKRLYVYSIIPFITLRCLEQIKVDVCYQNADVKVIGVGGGLDYPQFGSTHHSTEDISVMRSLHNMSVVCPSDPMEAAALPEALLKMRTPVYVRLGRGKEPMIHKQPPKMEPGRAFEIPLSGALDESTGSAGPVSDHITIFATGNITFNALKATERLLQKGLSVKLVSMPWIKPVDEGLILSEAAKSRLFVTVEEHSVIGGLRSAIVDLLYDKGVRIPLKSISLPDAFQKKVGDQEYLRKLNGLDTESIEKSIVGWLRS